MRIDPDRLFEHLLENSELIGYKRAYELLFGEVPTQWLNFEDAPPVTEETLMTDRRAVNGLDIKLDALMVAETTNQPGGIHFHNKAYNNSAWLQAFGQWRLCSHSDREIR